MRDIRAVMKRWGEWATHEENHGNWPSVCANFRGVLPGKTSLRPSCIDEDGLIIDACVSRLHIAGPVMQNARFSLPVTSCACLCAMWLTYSMRGVTPVGVALTSEQRRIQELEKQVRRLEMEKEILKQAAVLMSEIPVKSVR